MNGTGFNPEQVIAFADAIQTASNQVAETIKTNLQNEVIGKISTAWYAPEAFDLFESFKEAVNGEATNAINESFTNVFKSVESAAQAWAAATGYGEINIGSYTPITIGISNSVEKDNNGNIIIIEEDANNVANALGTVHQNIDDGLSAIANSLEAESSFLGGTQAATIKSCFVTIYKSVASIFSILMEGENNLKSQIATAVDKYGKLSADVSKAFSNSNGE